MALSPPRLLVLRALGLGDLLTAIPALRALQRAFPQAQRWLAVPQVLAPLVDLAGLDYTVLPTRGLAPLHWRGRSPDVAVNLHGRGPMSHRLLTALLPGEVVAFGNAQAGVDGPQWCQEEHERERWCRLVRERLGVPADPADLRLPRPRSSGSGPAVVHPGAASAARRWPAERFAVVARALAQRGQSVVVTGSTDEQLLARQVATAAGLPRHVVLAGGTTLQELATLVAQAPLVVCGDTGIAHLASAFGTPSVVLFGPTCPASWGPPQDGPHVVLFHGDGSGDPHGDVPDPALLQIMPSEVVAALEELAGRGRAPSAASAPAPRRR